MRFLFLELLLQNRSLLGLLFGLGFHGGELFFGQQRFRGSGLILLGEFLGFSRAGLQLLAEALRLGCAGLQLLADGRQVCLGGRKQLLQVGLLLLQAGSFLLAGLKFLLHFLRPLLGFGGALAAASQFAQQLFAIPALLFEGHAHDSV